MIDFRALSYFLVACEHENLGAAAQELGIAPSTLSASLKSLELEFGASLFRKQGAGLGPRRLAHWLYRAAVPLLLLEEFARRRIAATGDAPTVRLRIDVKLRFAFGQISRALNRAIMATAAAEPLVLCDPVWSEETGAKFGAAGLEQLGLDSDSHIVIEARQPRPGEIVLLEDRWMLVSRQVGHEHQGPDDFRRQQILVPTMPPEMNDQVIGHLKRAGIENIAQAGRAAGAWPQTLDENPGAAFLLPSSALAARLGTYRVSVRPLDPELVTPFVGVHDGDQVARRFAERLRDTLANPGPAAQFKPVLTGRRVRYFNLAHDLGRVSAAARAASVAQPALSQQLQKLEASVGTLLFERRTFGLIRTEAGAQFSRASTLLDKRLRELEMSGMSASLADGGRLSLGVLPSVSHHGHLISRITEALLELRKHYPAMSLTVQEAPNGTLQSWVTSGRVGVAIVETALPQLPRLPLDATEELCVIADPRRNLLPPGPVRLRDLTSLPLALPTRLFGIRQLVDVTARDAGVELKPRHEVDALAMLIAMLTRESIATVLPGSAVRMELESGELSAHPIIEPAIVRRLFVIYSGDRSLTRAERDLVRLLREKLAPPAAPGVRALSLAPA